METYSVLVRKFDYVLLSEKTSVCWLSEGVVIFEIDDRVYNKFGKLSAVGIVHCS